MTRRKLLRLVDIAELVGVSRQRVSVLRRRADFPIRSTGMGMATFWAAGDVRAWARTYDGGTRRWGRARIPAWRLSRPDVKETGDGYVYRWRKEGFTYSVEDVEAELPDGTRLRTRSNSGDAASALIALSQPARGYCSAVEGCGDP